MSGKWESIKLCVRVIREAHTQASSGPPSHPFWYASQLPKEARLPTSGERRTAAQHSLTRVRGGSREGPHL